MLKVKVALRHADEVYVAVEAAVEGEVGHLRVDAVVGGVVNADTDQGIAGAADRVGHVRAPGGVAAVVMGDVLAGDVQVRGGVRALNLDEQLVALGQILIGEGLHVPAQAAVKIARAVLTVDGVPGMGNIDKVSRLGHGGGQIILAHHERPLAVEADDISHGSKSFLYGFVPSLT